MYVCNTYSATDPAYIHTHIAQGKSIFYDQEVLILFLIIDVILGISSNWAVKNEQLPLDYFLHVVSLHFYACHIKKTVL